MFVFSGWLVPKFWALAFCRVPNHGDIDNVREFLGLHFHQEIKTKYMNIFELLCFYQNYLTRVKISRVTNWEWVPIGVRVKGNQA